MKSSSPANFTSLLSGAGLDEAAISAIAFSSGWLRRKPRKITAPQLLQALVNECLQGSASFNDLATQIDLDSPGHGPSKQAVAKRINQAFLSVLETLVGQVLRRKILPSTLKLPQEEWTQYRRVILQDSTVLKVPQWLFEIFSGVSNGHTQVCNIRIQITYDLKEMKLLSFSIDPYSKNDLAAAPELPLQEGDLVLRDRGYLIMDEFARHLEARAHCLYRYKSGMILRDPNTDQTIDVLRLLQSRGHLDQIIALNNKERTQVRLVSAPVDKITAEKRRRKVKKETHGHAPSQEVLALMDWTIYLTTIPPSEADFETLLTIYGLRWRIEIIFKSWKSSLHFDDLHQVSETQLRIILTTRLLLIVILSNGLYPRCSREILANNGRQLSLLRFFNYLRKNPAQVSKLLEALGSGSFQSSKTCQSLARYCCYEKRSRRNYHDTLNGLT